MKINATVRAHSREFVALFLASIAAMLPIARAKPDAIAGGVASQGDAANGMQLYQACAACHSVEENDIGPMHRGVVGRRAGSVVAYNYSAALKSSGIVWSEAQLDQWLKNPSALVPGTKMFFKLDDAQMRADIIAYLKTQN